MTTSVLTTWSDAIAAIVAGAAPSVVQVHGQRRPASGVVHAPEVVLAMAPSIGRSDTLQVRRDDGQAFDAELAGWDPTTGLAVLKVPGLAGVPFTPAAAAARVGHLAIAVARSWSNAVTASTGIVSVIGGPLHTGRRRAIDQVLRTNAPMHEGFAGGAFLDASGALLGVATAAAIRGLGVIIPAAIAWKAADDVLRHGRLKRGYLGLAGQPVRLPEGQRPGTGQDQALLVAAVVPDSPAAAAGVLVGDVVVALDGARIESAEDLLELLTGDRVGRDATLGLVRGGSPLELRLTIGERLTH